MTKVEECASGFKMVVPALLAAGAVIEEVIETPDLISWRFAHPEGVIITIAIAKDER